MPGSQVSGRAFLLCLAPCAQVIRGQSIEADSVDAALKLAGGGPLVRGCSQRGGLSLTL